MKKYVILGLCFINTLVIAQNNKVKLLFDLTGDLRNPSFLISSGYENNNSLLFEVHKDSTSNIFISDYIEKHDSFSTPYPLTEGNNFNVNPIGFGFNESKIIFFQTNLKGRWNIAYREYLNNMWEEIRIIDDSLSDNIEVSPVKESEGISSIVYQKENSIYRFLKNYVKDSNEIILQSSENVKYSSPVGCYSEIYWPDWKPRVLRIAAIQSDGMNYKKIIMYEKNLNFFNSTITTIDSGNVKNPQFSRKDYSYILTYEKIVDGHSNIYYYDNDERTTYSINLNDTLYGDFYNLKTENSQRPIIDIFKKSRFDSFVPYTFNFYTENKSGISINNRLIDTLINTRMINPSSAVELIGNYIREVNYAVWEDSMDSRVKLFALKLKTSIPDDVITRIFPQEYHLSQNYPNPFNPSTTISYQLPIAGLVTLKIYDLLGREISTLVEEEKLPGYYQTIFDGSKLASGVYLYRLQSGSFNSTKKFVLMK